MALAPFLCLTCPFLPPPAGCFRLFLWALFFCLALRRLLPLLGLLHILLKGVQPQGGGSGGCPPFPSVSVHPAFCCFSCSRQHEKEQKAGTGYAGTAWQQQRWQRGKYNISISSFAGSSITAWHTGGGSSRSRALHGSQANMGLLL